MEVDATQANPEPSVIDLAWLAGIVDGEGSIGSYYHGASRVPTVKVSVYNSNWPLVKRVISIIHAITKRRVTASEKPRVRKGKNLRVWQVVVNRKSSADQLLRILIPYMTAKRPQAERAVAILRWRHRRGAAVPTWVHDLSLEIKRLNNTQPQPDDEGAETKDATAVG